MSLKAILNIDTLSFVAALMQTLKYIGRIIIINVFHVLESILKGINNILIHALKNLKAK